MEAYDEQETMVGGDWYDNIDDSEAVSSGLSSEA